jgi:hypothetical protein
MNGEIQNDLMSAWRVIRTLVKCAWYLLIAWACFAAGYIAYSAFMAHVVGATSWYG